VRRLAREAGLSVYDKPDSTGICFIGERPFQEFLSRYLRTAPGPIENDHGQVIGEHRGLALYTLGQRSGLGIGGRAGSAAAPWYVADKDMARNALIVVQDQDHPLLLSDAFDVEQLHWLNSDGRAWTKAGQSNVRSRPLSADAIWIAPYNALSRRAHRTAPCTSATKRATASGDPIWRVTLVKPARAVTPGQYAVFYQGALCLGGGVIARRFNSCMPYVGRGITYNSQFSVEGS
jgi:tRNA-specific 2-thiouridylase